MKILFSGLLFICSIIPAFAQKPLQVINWKADQTVNAFLLSKMHEQYDERRARLGKALQSSALAVAYRDSCRVRYRNILGLLPERSPLKSSVEGKIKQQGYHIEKIIYESIPDHHVTANLYVPDGKGPFPGVLLFCGHEDDAKATESYQRTAILFAINGFVVLVIDPISQGERHQLTDGQHKPLTRGGTTEHTLVNAAANLVGSGTVAYQLWDNIRGLDFLESRPEVDKNKIGCLGNSGGGTQATYFIAFDDRIKVAAPCSFIASRERNFDLFGPNDGCQHIPFEGAAQLEISDFLIMFAPKPLLILAGKYDFVDYYGTTLAFNDVSTFYQTLHAGNEVSLFSVEDGHGISFPKRDAAVRWFRKWLYNDSTIVNEADFKILSREELSATGVAQVSARFPQEKNDLARSFDVAVKLRQTRTKVSVQSKVKTVLKMDLDESNLMMEMRGTVEHNGLAFRKFLVRKKNLVPLPVLLLLPKNTPSDVVFWVHEKGKQILADSVSLLREYLLQNKAVVLADITGVGELKDPESVNDPKYYNAEYRNAMLGLHTGLSTPALRTYDVFALVDFIQTQPELKGKPIHLYAQGMCSIPGLHAAVLDQRISTIHVVDGISSFEDVMKKPLQRDWYSNMLPNVLRYYDVKDLLMELKDRVIVVAK